MKLNELANKNSKEVKYTDIYIYIYIYKELTKE